MKPLRSVCLRLLLLGGLLTASIAPAATFTNNASIQVGSGSALSFGSGSFTISCWFRMSIPSGVTVNEDMVILMDRSDGNDAANFSYLLRYNTSNGKIEFVTRGSAGTPYVRALIDRPYLERWYHVAITRSGSGGVGVFNAYVDGRALNPFFEPANLGDTTGSGLSIGGVNGNSKLFFGEIIEVSIFQSGHALEDLQVLRFSDATALGGLRAYYKLGYSTNSADHYRNFAPAPPAGTELAQKVGSGEIIFEETDQAGEQSTFDSRKNRGDTALTPLSGAFGWQQTALSRPVPGIAFHLRFGYSSANPATPSADGGFDPYERRVLGPGWRHTFDTRLFIESSANELKLLSWDGAIETWSRSNLFAPFIVRHKEYRGELRQLSSGDLEWTTPERLVYHFSDPISGGSIAGRLTEIRDFNSNTVRIAWDTVNRLIGHVTDSAGGRWEFTYDTNRYRLTNVSFGSWRLRFEFDSLDRLVSKALTNTSGLYTNVETTWRFEYHSNQHSSNLLARVIDPRGFTNVLIHYDQYGRKTNEMDALGRSTHTEYGVPEKRRLRHTDAEARQWVETYDRKGRILIQKDPLGNETRYTYDERGNRTSITEPLGWTTFYGYDERGNVIAVTNALGEATRWTFHPVFNKAVQQIAPQPLYVNGQPFWTNFYDIDERSGNLLRHRDALGTLVSYSYETNGLVLSSTDANTNTTSFRYDTNGFLITKTEPFTTNSTVTTRYGVNDVGWKLHEVNARGDTTYYELDINGNPVRTQDVIGRNFYRSFDPNGNLTAASDAMNQFTRHTYDAANQRIQTVDRAGYTNLLFYTGRGKLERAVNPLGHTVTNYYDAANRLERVSDPLGNTSTNVYDANGNLVALINQLGQRWTKSYDRLNRVIAETDPLGNTRRTTYDEAGRVREIITPNGFSSLHAYDGRGRLKKWTDAEGFGWLYTYDGNANIVDIEDALHGHYVMTYGSRNERTSERNQDDFEWQYDYDELLRLKSQRDPNGTTRIPEYDAAGRVLGVEFSTGRRDTFTPDENDNPKIVSRRSGSSTTSMRFTYDVLDRPIEQTDAHNQTVIYGYDPVGCVTAITYPDGKTLTNVYDALGRLTGQVDWSGREMIYAYDHAGRLIRRTYPNSVVQTNSFDYAGRLTGLSYSTTNPQPSAISTAFQYAYDRTGNKIGSSERGALNWPVPSLTDETSEFTESGRLKDRRVHGATSGETARIAYTYDPSGNMTNASGGDQSWSLAYDEDNRTTSIVWATNGASHRLDNRYDALGRRIGRNLDGTQTAYVLNLVGDMERILCDLDHGGNITAWYIHGPDLCYRVDASSNVVYYHADAMANVIALSGTNGTNLAQYAYTPYGRILGSTNPQSKISNPYLFVGSQGVMEEMPRLYFMRARYYSADAGVFLSTDPVKKIGPGWKPSLHAYPPNPISVVDPSGAIFVEAFSSVSLEGQFAFSHLGRSFEIYDQPKEETIYVASRPVFGWGIKAGISVEVLKVYGGDKHDWEDYDKVEIPLGPVSIAVAHSPVGKFGISLGASAGVGRGFIRTRVNKSDEAAIWNRSDRGPLLESSRARGVTDRTATMPNAPNQTVASSDQASVLNHVQATTKRSPSGNTGISSSTTYTVRAGDTLGNIGYAHGTTASDLGKANNIPNLNRIHPGQVLTIPRRHP